MIDQENNKMGCPTIREQLAEVQLKLGLQEASAFRVVTVGGETILVVSTDNPALDRREPISKVEPVSSADAGSN